MPSKATVRIVFQATLLGAALGASMESIAQTESGKWGYRTSLTGGQYFSSYGAAEAAMKSVSNPEDAPFLVRKDSMQSGNSGEIITNYWVPPATAVEQPEYYQDPTLSGLFEF